MDRNFNATVQPAFGSARPDAAKEAERRAKEVAIQAKEVERQAKEAALAEVDRLRALLDGGDTEL